MEEEELELKKKDMMTMMMMKWLPPQAPLQLHLSWFLLAENDRERPAKPSNQWDLPLAPFSSSWKWPNEIGICLYV